MAGGCESSSPLTMLDAATKEAEGHAPGECRLPVHCTQTKLAGFHHRSKAAKKRKALSGWLLSAAWLKLWEHGALLVTASSYFHVALFSCISFFASFFPFQHHEEPSRIRETDHQKDAELPRLLHV